MKKVHFLAVIILLFHSACEKETLTYTETQQYVDNETTADFTGAQTVMPGQVVIKYDPLLTEIEKQAIRDQYGVENYKNCSCADPTLELWIFEVDANGDTPSGLSIEGVVESSKDNSGVEGSEINPVIKHNGYKLSAPFGTDHITTAIDLMSPANNGVTIAVLDTGIDYNYFKFEEPFLYNSDASGTACNDNGMTDYFGWDFVQQDNNPFDEHGHATQVISMIYEKLDEQNIDFQVLPVKVFDGNGDGAYFDILCGFKYAANNEDVKLINMSFGWYNTHYSLLERFMEETWDKKVILTSAGNLSSDNDTTPHYPSSYDEENLLSIASWNGSFTEVGLSRFSNYGVNSVDLAAPGENIPFYLTPNDFILLHGTSYASAFTTGVAAGLYVPGMSPNEHITTIISNSIPDNNLQNIKYHSYIYY
ncbi:MAG: hypothetical protein Aureis2KO_00320 [Aureisphaera sp.]